MRLLGLVPAAFGAHVAEEAPGFTSWARRNTSERFTALGMFVPLWVARKRAAVRQRLMTRRGAAAGTAVATLVHALVVADQVYFVDLRTLRR